jgi:hypothetical protein
MHTCIQVIRDPAKHMCGEAVAVGPARIVLCDHDLERMDIAAGDVPYVCMRAGARAHHAPTGVCAWEKQEGVRAGNGVHVLESVKRDPEECQKRPSRV